MRNTLKIEKYSIVHYKQLLSQTKTKMQTYNLKQFLFHSKIQYMI